MSSISTITAIWPVLLQRVKASLYKYSFNYYLLKYIFLYIRNKITKFHFINFKCASAVNLVYSLTVLVLKGLKYNYIK